jgi:hypothetical protein
MRARLGYVALLLASTGMTVVIVSLWLTEVHLPLRAQLAFAVMSVIGASWTAISVWALMTRRILLARDRVIAGGMAVTFTSLFVIGAAAASALTRNAAAFGALATGLVMLAIAVWTFMRARRRFAALSARRTALEQNMGG